MKKALLVIVILVLGLGYHYRPDFSSHQNRIVQKASGAEGAVTDVESLPIWEEVEYKDWKLVTAAQHKTRHTLISIGIAGYVRVVDRAWAMKALGIVPATPEEAAQK